MQKYKVPVQRQYRPHKRNYIEEAKQPATIISPPEDTFDITTSFQTPLVDEGIKLEMEDAIKVWELAYDTEVWLMGFTATPDIKARLKVFQNFEVVRDNKGNEKEFLKPLKFQAGKQMVSNPLGKDVAYINLNGRKLLI